MANFKNLLDKNKLMTYFGIIVAIFLAFSYTHQEPKVSIKAIRDNKMTEVEKLAKDNQELRSRLAKLEPVSPVKIIRADQPSYSAGDIPVVGVMTEGTRVPFTRVYEDANWARPDYEPYWHSETGQWSSVPDRIHSSYHRLFVTPGHSGLWNETIHECGIVELADRIHLPVFDEHPENTIVIVGLQHQITDVLLLNNQIVLMGTPSRNGIQVLALNKRDLTNSESGEIMTRNNNRQYLFQLATPDGYEVDYNNVLISY